MQLNIYTWPFKCQPLKMVKHTHTICRADELFSLFDHFLGLALKELQMAVVEVETKYAWCNNFFKKVDNNLKLT